MVKRGKEEAARGRTDARDSSPSIFTHGGGRFAKCGKMGKGYGELLEMSFFSFFFSKKNMDRKGIWGILGDALIIPLKKAYNITIAQIQ